ncbi:cytochrome P450 [Limnohabitans sp. DM1]|uniref:cytochrome P450 n=1 Tax=Limnohabitans sp. DM1 TaxID=1597955 RepID=UPI000B050C68|nr:cytochrome P450 [Limnohabitans sp. DM1]
MKTQTQASHTLPPGPSAPLWGLNHLRTMKADYLGFVADLQRQQPDIAHVQVLNEHITHVFHPEWVRQVLVDQADALIRWERATDVFSVSMGQSVLVTEGVQWQRQRRMLQPGFSPKRVAGYAALMTSAAQDALGDLARRPAEQSVDMDALMTTMTLDVILRALFGAHQVTDARPISEAIQTLSHSGIQEMFKRFSWPLWMPLPSVRKVRHAKQTLDRMIQQHIQASPSAKQHDGEDLLTMLRQARDPEHPDQGLSAQELHDQTMVMFQAGHETTATAMTWWCGLIARHPEVAERIHAEVDAVLQGEPPTPASLQQLPWLQASLKEAMRLYPPAAILFTRRACRALTVGPWTLPKGHLMAFTPYVIQRDPRWFESPDAFKPERFLPDAPPMPRGTWMPFGTGARVCIAQHFAMLEMGLIGAMLMQRFNLVWPEGAAWPKGDLAVTLRPAQPIRLRLHARE